MMIRRIFVDFILLIFIISLILLRTKADRAVDWIIEAGYPVESHKVVTKDAYILTVHRIPYHKNYYRGSILLAHAIVYSGLQWIIYHGKSLAYLLAEEGYDVWIYHARGTSYSSKHKIIKSSDKKYWNFSWHEFGQYDLPAVINRMLSITNDEKIHFVGHSQGCTALLVMLSTRPEYNKKVASAYFLAPAAFLEQTSGTAYFTRMDKTLRWLRQTYIGRNNRVGLCRYRIFAAICYKALTPLLGPISSKVDLEKSLIVSAKYLVDSVSVKQITHYVQLVQSRRFQRFDFGKSNIYYYGMKYPPLYNLSQVQVPITLRRFSNDYIVTKRDVDQLTTHLQNVKSIGTFPGNHVEFLFDIVVTNRIKNDIIDSFDLLDKDENYDIRLKKHPEVSTFNAIYEVNNTNLVPYMYY